MSKLAKPSSVCPEHGMPRHRASCRGCNAAYMRDYGRRRRQDEPDKELWRRARKRAERLGIPFDLAQASVVIPPYCPVLGIPLWLSGTRSPGSPSLDRIVPVLGYVAGNVRVISDRANRLKADHTLVELRALEERSSGPLKSEYRLVAEYVEREDLLDEVRSKVSSSKSGREWKKIADFLENVFSRGHLVTTSVDVAM